MPVIKRGFLYITRKRGRSILLLVIMFVAAVLVMLGLTARNITKMKPKAILRAM